MIQRDVEELRGVKIFGSRIIDEVKGKDTITLYKKSRWVVQGFNNLDKKTVLIESLTI